MSFRTENLQDTTLGLCALHFCVVFSGKHFQNTNGSNQSIVLDGMHSQHNQKLLLGNFSPLKSLGFDVLNAVLDWNQYSYGTFTQSSSNKGRIV